MPNNRNRNRNRNRNKRNKQQQANHKQQTAEEETTATTATAAAEQQQEATSSSSSLTAAVDDQQQNEINANSGSFSNGSSSSSTSTSAATATATVSDSVTVADEAPAGIADSNSNNNNEERSAQVTSEEFADQSEVQLEEPEQEVNCAASEQSNQPEAEHKTEPRVHLVPVTVEREENLPRQREEERVQSAVAHSTEQPKVHLVPVTVEREENLQQATQTVQQEQEGDQSVDQVDQPKVHFVPVTVEPRPEHEMGAKNSKQQQQQLPEKYQQLPEQQTQPAQQQQQPTQAEKPPGSPRQAKVIVHRIVRDNVDETDCKAAAPQQQAAAQRQQPTQQQRQEPPQPAPHSAPLQRSTKVIIHQIRLETDEEERARIGKPTIEEISSTTATSSSSSSATTTAAATETEAHKDTGTLSPPPRYLVESPSPKTVSSVAQFGKFARDVQIQELELNSDSYSSGEFNSSVQSPVVCEFSDSEPEPTSSAAAPISAVTAFPADLPSSSRAEQQELLRQKRAQKRNALESHFLPQLLSPRYLDSILEENSETASGGSGHDLASLSRSSSVGNADATKTRPAVPAKANETFPRSHLDFSRRHKRREEPVALMLETKLLEQPSDVESCTRLQSTLSPQSEDAELVYLSSSASSSVSDLMELELEQAAALAERALIDLDTDASRLITRPDDEMSSTTTSTMEHISSSNETETEGECEVETEVDTETEANTARSQSSRESTPVNAPQAASPSPGSSLSSLLSAATPTPTPTETPIAAAASTTTTTTTPTPAAREAAASGASENEFGSGKLANSSSATAAPSTSLSLSGTREEFVRNMEKVRELIEMTRREESAIENGNGNGNANGNANGNESENVKRNEQLKSWVAAATEQQQQLQQQQELRCRLNSSPSPPPVPPPPSSMHYPACSANTSTNTESPNVHPILAPLLLKRQESNDSHCSDSTQHSQCTAINLASPPPLPAQPPTPPIRNQQQQQQQQQQQLQAELSAISQFSAEDSEAERIKKLRLLCTETLASMPYGEQMLEELASVAQNISNQQQQQLLEKQQQQQHKQQQQQHADSNMPYPLPQLPHIGELQLSLDTATGNKQDAWLGMPTQADPKLLVCLSPGQRALVEQQQQQQQSRSAPDQLLDAHEKFVQRRGYHELSAEQVRAMDSEQLKLEQEQILKTAAKMRELRKSLTPTSTSPPPSQPSQPQQPQLSPVPPPVPVKSAETAAKAKSQAAAAQADDASQLRGNSSYQKVITSTATAAATTAAAATSSFENKPKQAAATAAAAADQPQSSQQLPRSFDQRTSSRTEQQQQQRSSSSSYMSHSNNNNNNDGKFPASMESELARMFPSIAKQGDIFDEQRKRFSNIEQSLQQRPQVQSKRYSNIETSSFESKKRTENGQVVYDYSNSSRQQQEEGEKPDKFPLREAAATAANVHHIPVRQEQPQQQQPQQQQQDDVADCAPPVPPPPAANIMSATKLNGAPKANTFIDDAQQQQQQQQQQQFSESSRQQHRETAAISKVNSSNGGGTYEEFRQRAKAALEAIAQPHPPNGSNSNTQPSLDNEKLFKDFDALSQQLNAELQTSRDQRQQREKSASLYDLSRLSLSQQQQEQLKRERHAHMQELEREIERSARSRQERLSSVPRNMEHNREIPIELAPDYAAPRSRRAESLCNLSEPVRPHSSAEHYRHEVHQQQQQQDDWSRYASDLGYSENIARPFAREVEICYQRQGQGQGQRQPHGIRAPRLSASTNDLSSSSYDSYNAYGGARRHAPMLQQAPPQQRPHYASCYSMIERNPNPTYISTTSRRGVSPAPPAPAAAQPPAYDRQQRRASLPRELHEQQLKYILSKEEELKLEFERLQQERRRLMDEMQRAPTVLQAPPPRRDSYRPAAKLPTLSEDEVFRQQMAEEWMNKVAEREERRQHKIIKISKIEDEQQHATEEQANISDEFLNRVKERRHKLAMPADSDWESGAESQPVQAGGNGSDAEAPPVRVIEGQSEANLRELPRHLREFAKFSTCEQLEGGQGQVERHEQQERSETATDNSLSSASKKSTIVKTYKVSRLPPSVQDDKIASNDNENSNKHSNNNNNNQNNSNNNNNSDNPSNTSTTSASTTKSSRTEHESNSSSKFSWSGETEPASPSASASSPPFLGNFHRNFDELFAHSPFRSKIFEEFDKYWRNFEHSTTSDSF